MYAKDQDHSKALAEHCDFFHQLLHYRSTSLASAYTLPPMRWNGVLSTNGEAEHFRNQLLEEWSFLLKLEGASLHSRETSVLDKMYWRLGTFVRVLCMAHEQDMLAGRSCRDGRAYPLQLLVAKTLGDSRVIEVAHQQGPDLARAGRTNTVPPVPIMAGTIKSGALELRKVSNTIQVDPTEMVYNKKNYRAVNVKKKLDPRSHKLDKGLQRMMRRRQGKNFFPSPAPASLFPSLAATEWAWTYCKEQYPGGLEDSWMSCIAGKPGDVLAHLPTSSLVKVVGCAEYGVLTWHMDVSSSSNNSYFMRPNRSLLHWMHITKLDDWVHVPTKPFVTEDCTIEWMRTGQPLPLPIALVQGGVELNVVQLKKLLAILKINRQGCNDRAGLHTLLVENILCNPDEKQKAMNAYERAGQEEPLDSDLEDVISCLDEEDANTLDLKELKEKKKKKRYQTVKTDASKPVRGAGRARGRGRGRGRPSGGGAARGRAVGGRGRGRGRGRVRKDFIKHTGSKCSATQMPSPAEPAPATSPLETEAAVPEPHSPLAEHGEAEPLVPELHSHLAEHGEAELVPEPHSSLAAHGGAEPAVPPHGEPVPEDDSTLAAKAEPGPAVPAFPSFVATLGEQEDSFFAAGDGPEPAVPAFPSFVAALGEQETPQPELHSFFAPDDGPEPAVLASASSVEGQRGAPTKGVVK